MVAGNQAKRTKDQIDIEFLVNRAPSFQGRFMAVREALLDPASVPASKGAYLTGAGYLL
jgi:hypothetical protein